MMSKRRALYLVCFLMLSSSVSLWYLFRPLPAIHVAVAPPNLSDGVPLEYGPILRMRLSAELSMFRNTHALRSLNSSDLATYGADEIVLSTVELYNGHFRVELKRSFPSGASYSSGDFLTPNSAKELLETSSNYLRVVYSDRTGFSAQASQGDFIAFSEICREQNPERLLSALEKLRISGKAPVESSLYEIEVARYLFELKNDSKYLDKAKSILSSLPSSDRKMMAHSRIALASGDIATAKAMLKNVGALPNLWAYKVSIAEAEDRIDDALNIATAARDSYFKFEELSRLAYLNKDYRNARAHTITALNMCHNGVLRKRLAHIELQLGNLDAADSLYKRILADGARDAVSLNRSAIVNILKGNYASAANTYEYLLSVEPDREHIVLNLAEAYHLLGDERAGFYYRSFLDLSSHNNSLTVIASRAFAFAAVGQNSDALYLIESIDAQDVKSPEIFFYISMAYSVLGDQKRMAFFAKKSVDLGQPGIWFDLPWFGNVVPQVLSVYEDGKDTIKRESYRDGFINGKDEGETFARSKYMMVILFLTLFIPIALSLLIAYRKVRGRSLNLQNEISRYHEANAFLMQSLSLTSDDVEKLDSSIEDWKYYYHEGMREFADTHFDLVLNSFCDLKSRLRGCETSESCSDPIHPAV